MIRQIGCAVVWPGKSGSGAVRRGVVRQIWSGEVGHVAVGRGKVRQIRRGAVMLGAAG